MPAESAPDPSRGASAARWVTDAEADPLYRPVQLSRGQLVLVPLVLAIAAIVAILVSVLLGGALVVVIVYGSAIALAIAAFALLRALWIWASRR